MSFEDFEDELDQISSSLRTGIPALKVMSQGSKTVIRNFDEVRKSLNREPSHIKKYLASRLGAKMVISDGQLEVSKKLRSSQLEQVFEDYADRYIFCPNCGKPDTLLQGSGKKPIMKCLACGDSRRIN